MGDAEIELAPKAAPLKRGDHHRPFHWVVLVFNVFVALICFAGAAILVIGQRVLTDTKKSAAIEAPPTTQPPPSVSIVVPGSSTTPETVIDGTVLPSDPAIPATTVPFPVADPNAQNFLITGSDNRACPDANSTNPVPNRDTLGERSDSIMIMRVDPSTSRAAVLSFPRDLWVKIHGTNGRNRINAAYVLNYPQKMIDTIYDNFQIKVDHSIQVDFCAFKSLVEAVGGVSVYFNYPARDTHTGLEVPVTEGCYTFNGDAALAYVRSRHYQYLNPKNGKWTEDPASDYGRISRQQDFLRRAVAQVLSMGYDLTLARSLIDVATKYVVVDADLTIEKELQFAGVLKNLDPQNIETYQIEGFGKVIGGAAVIEPRLDGANMKAILAIFRGEVQLATAPVQVFETTTTGLALTTTTVAPTTTGGGQTGSTTKTGAPATGSTTKAATTATTAPTTTIAPTTTVSNLPQTNATGNDKGIFPPKDKTCP